MSAILKVATVNSVPICGNDQRCMKYNDLLREYQDHFSKFSYNNKIGTLKLDDRHPVLAATLVRLAEIKKAKNILEIGFEFGWSAIPLALYAHLNDAYYTGLDPLRPDWGVTEQWADMLREYLAKEALTRARLIDETFDVKKHASEHGPYDFVFIDHDKVLYSDDFQSIVEEPGFITSDAWILVHDVDPENAKEPGANMSSNGDHLTWQPLVKYCLETDCGKPTMMKDGCFGTVCYDLGLIEMGVSNVS